jgi:hypothetical protein
LDFFYSMFSDETKNSRIHSRLAGFGVSYLVFGMTGLMLRKSTTNIYRCGILWAIILALLWCCSEGEPPATVSKGSGKSLRLIIKWPGDDMASKQDLELRDKIGQNIVARQIGKIVRSGTGMGWMDIVFEVKDPDRARAEIEAIVRGIAPDANFAVQAE